MKTSAEEFIRIWQTSKNAREVARKARVSYGAVINRALMFRRKGIPLKKFRAAAWTGLSRPVYDLPKLAALAQSLLKSNGDY